MKKFLLPLLALALTATAASAQDVQNDQMAPMQGQGPRRSPDEMAAMQTKRLTQELSLTPDQAAKVQQILLTRMQDRQAMRSQMQSGDRSQMREQMQANRAKYEEQFKSVLTPDQYTKFAAMEQRGGGRGMGPGGPGRPAPADQPVDGKVKVKNDKVKIKATDN